MKIWLVAMTFVAGLAGCATVSQDITYDPAKGETFLMLAAEGITADLPGSYTYTLRRVDLTTSTFQSEWTNIVFDAGAGTFVVHEFKKPDSVATTVRFGGRAVTPGDYALVSRSDLRSGMVQSTYTNCYSLGAPVFRILPGQINLVAINDAPLPGVLDDEKALSQAGEVLSLYPNMRSTRAMAERIGSITFGTGKVLGTQVCSKRNMPKFSFTSAK